MAILSTRISWPSLPLLVAATLTLGVPPLAHAGPQGEDFEQTMARAGALAEEGEHARALEAFEATFETMPNEMKIGGIGEFVAYSGARSALEHFNATGDTKALQSAKTLLESFIDAVEQAPNDAATASTDRAAASLEMVTSLLESSSDSDVPPPTEEPPQDELEEPLEPPIDDPPPKSRGLGIGLTIAGGVLAAGGITTIIVGSQNASRYEDDLVSMGWMPDPDGEDYEQRLGLYQDELDKASRARKVSIGVGAGIATVGVGLLIYGVIRLAKGGPETQAALIGGPAFAVGSRPRGALSIRF